ncbi:trans-sialidase [Trypanosoma cruzi Dm28c]|uniref:Trans-sialidase n=2 Tax=Trypanosoma cruzi TaxID=5693 RepID=V5B7R4_TRYCR|nr:trans-sialidase [Trypanosoma cruzi Dm28c]PWU90132.1 putative trans-sialidase, Group V [Trypanosoma cruzi]
MLSRVAAVKAPRTHNCRRVTGSSGRRREGRESEPQRPNMSRRVFASAVLLLLVVMMWCGIGGGTALVDGVEEPLSSETKFQWEAITEGETVTSLRVPSLVVMNGEVFAVAEAQCTKDQNSVFTGIASQIITNTADNKPEELLKNAKEKTQILEEGGSPEGNKKVDVSRPTAVVDGSDIYMLVGKHSHEAADTCQAGTENIKSGMLLVKGQVSGDGDNKKIDWKTTDGVPCTLGGKHESLSQLIGGGGSGVKLTDDTLLFPVESTKKDGTGKDGKLVSLIIYSSKEVTNWNLSKGASEGGCSVPSVVEWEDKLMMMTACGDGRRRVYEIGDKGESWTEALGTLSRVWGNRKGNEKAVGSGFITTTIDGVEDNRNVMLVTLPVYPKKEKEKGELHLWLTDNTHIVDIGPVPGDDDAAASSLLYKSGKSGDKKEELIALYEKKKDGEKPSLGMVSVLLTEQLQRVKEVLATWKEVDDLVSKLCTSSNPAKDASTANGCGAVKITDGLVGFLSGSFSDGTWRDEYLGVNATVNTNEGAEKTDNGVTFKGRGAGAQWPVGKQGENQLYHFANYNFTLVATVSIDGEPTKEGPIPLMGAKINDGDNNLVLLGLSYNKEKKWILLCGGGENKEHSSSWEPDTTHQVAIVLQNAKQGSAYVDGKPLEGMPFDLKDKGSKVISHFYIGGDGDSAEGQEGVSVTVTNVLLYNRPLTSEEIDALNPNKAPTPTLVEVPTKPLTVSSASVVTPIPPVAATAQIAGTSSTPAGTHLTEREQPLGSSGADSGGASTSAVSAVSIPSAEKDSVKQVASGKTSDGAQTVDGGSTADGEPTMEKREGTDGQEEEVQPLNREVNATALNSSLGRLSQGNNSDAATVRGSGLLPSLLLLLGLWVFAAL